MGSEKIVAGGCPDFTSVLAGGCQSARSVLAGGCQSDRSVLAGGCHSPKTPKTHTTRGTGEIGIRTVRFCELRWTECSYYSRMPDDILFM